MEGAKLSVGSWKGKDVIEGETILFGSCEGDNVAAGDSVMKGDTGDCVIDIKY